MRPLKVLITDDEPHCRSELKFLLEEIGDIDVVGEAENAAQALDFLTRNDVDLVFLDIEMGEDTRSGLSLAEKLSAQTTPPCVIYVTVHLEYALEAYDHYPLPLHFLSKPVDKNRLNEAVQRVRLQVKPGKLALKYRETNDDNEHIYPIAYVDPSEIVYIQTTKMANTVTVQLQDNRVLGGVRQTLEQFRESLGDCVFLSPHSSFLVNPDFIACLKPRQSSGELYNLQLKGRDKEIPVSGGRLNDVKLFLQSI